MKGNARSILRLIFAVTTLLGIMTLAGCCGAAYLGHARPGLMWALVAAGLVCVVMPVAFARVLRRPRPTTDARVLALAACLGLAGVPLGALAAIYADALGWTDTFRRVTPPATAACLSAWLVTSACALVALKEPEA